MFEEADLIHSYSRAEALADGVLVDVSALARSWGFRYPMAVTARVYAAVTEGLTSEAAKQEQLARMLEALHAAIRRALPDGDNVAFTVALPPPQSLALWSRIGPGDTPDPVITIMLPDED